MSCKYCPYRAAYVEEVVPPACWGSPPAAHFHQTPDILLGGGAGGRWCRALQNYHSLETAPRHSGWAGAVSGGWYQLLHVTLVRCPAVVVAWCRAAAKPGLHVPIRNGQQQARPVAGGRGKLYQCQGHAAGHWVDTLTCSCPSVVTGWRLGDWDTAPPTNVTTKYRCCHGASWRVTRDACPHLLRHSFSDDFISPDTTWGRHIRPWRTEQPSRIWKLNCINISAPPQENSRQARCVKDRSPNLEFSWQGFYLVYTEYRRLSLTLVDRNTSLSSVKYLLYAEADTCIVMKSKYLDDIFT